MGFSTTRPGKSVTMTLGTFSGLPRIYLISQLTGRWPPVLQAILDKMVKGKGIKEYWRAGCTGLLPTRTAVS